MIETDVLIIGSGIAGLTAAYYLGENNIKTIIITKEEDSEESNTLYAQGGIVGRGSTDDPEALKKDIMSAGDGISNPDAIDIITGRGVFLVKEFLIDKIDVPFTRDEKGEILYTKEANHSRRRILFAKDESGKVKGLLVERGMEGFTTPEIFNKWSLRASATGELVFDNVKVPKENLLPGIKGLKGPLMCLNSARYGIAWGVLGAAMECYDTALQYALERKQFGKPVASFQLQQKKLAEMITEITKGQLLVWRLGVLKNEGKATPAQISMAKRNNVEMALKIARDSRQILGAMGITGDFPIMRHMMNLESVITYEGTHDVHLLITGMDVTEIPAFS